MIILLLLKREQREHYIDISQFDSVKCDDECVNDIADATIDMMCDHWSVHFDILTI